MESFLNQDLCHGSVSLKKTLESLFFIAVCLVLNTLPKRNSWWEGTKTPA